VPISRLRRPRSRTGEEALKHALASATDVVSWTSTCPAKRARDRQPHESAGAGTAVVMLSTHDTPYHRLAAKNAGAAAYIASTI